MRILVNSLCLAVVILVVVVVLWLITPFLLIGALATICKAAKLTWRAAWA